MSKMVLLNNLIFILIYIMLINSSGTFGSSTTVTPECIENVLLIFNYPLDTSTTTLSSYTTLTTTTTAAVTSDGSTSASMSSSMPSTSIQVITPTTTMDATVDVTTDPPDTSPSESSSVQITTNLPEATSTTAMPSSETETNILSSETMTSNSISSQPSPAISSTQDTFESLSTAEKKSTMVTNAQSKTLLVDSTSVSPSTEVLSLSSTMAPSTISVVENGMDSSDTTLVTESTKAPLTTMTAKRTEKTTMMEESLTTPLPITTLSSSILQQSSSKGYEKQSTKPSTTTADMITVTKSSDMPSSSNIISTEKIDKTTNLPITSTTTMTTPMDKASSINPTLSFEVTTKPPVSKDNHAIPLTTDFSTVNSMPSKVVTKEVNQNDFSSPRTVAQKSEATTVTTSLTDATTPLPKLFTKEITAAKDTASPFSTSDISSFSVDQRTSTDKEKTFTTKSDSSPTAPSQSFSVATSPEPTTSLSEMSSPLEIKTSSSVKTKTTDFKETTLSTNELPSSATASAATVSLEPIASSTKEQITNSPTPDNSKVFHSETIQPAMSTMSFENLKPTSTDKLTSTDNLLSTGESTTIKPVTTNQIATDVFSASPSSALTKASSESNSKLTTSIEDTFTTNPTETILTEQTSTQEVKDITKISPSSKIFSTNTQSSVKFEKSKSTLNEVVVTLPPTTESNLNDLSTSGNVFDLTSVKTTLENSPDSSSSQMEVGSSKSEKVSTAKATSNFIDLTESPSPTSHFDSVTDFVSNAETSIVYDDTSSFKVSKNPGLTFLSTTVPKMFDKLISSSPVIATDATTSVAETFTNTITSESISSSKSDLASSSVNYYDSRSTEALASTNDKTSSVNNNYEMASLSPLIQTLSTKSDGFVVSTSDNVEVKKSSSTIVTPTLEKAEDLSSTIPSTTDIPASVSSRSVSSQKIKDITTSNNLKSGTPSSIVPYQKITVTSIENNLDQSTKAVTEFKKAISTEGNNYKTITTTFAPSDTSTKDETTFDVTEQSEMTSLNGKNLAHSSTLDAFDTSSAKILQSTSPSSLNSFTLSPKNIISTQNENKNDGGSSTIKFDTESTSVPNVKFTDQTKLAIITSNSFKSSTNEKDFITDDEKKSTVFNTFKTQKLSQEFHSSNKPTDFESIITSKKITNHPLIEESFTSKPATDYEGQKSTLAQLTLKSDKPLTPPVTTITRTGQSISTLKNKNNPITTEQNSFETTFATATPKFTEDDFSDQTATTTVVKNYEPASTATPSIRPSSEKITNEPTIATHILTSNPEITLKNHEQTIKLETKKPSSSIDIGLASTSNMDTVTPKMMITGGEETNLKPSSAFHSATQAQIVSSQFTFINDDIPYSTTSTVNKNDKTTKNNVEFIQESSQANLFTTANSTNQENIGTQQFLTHSVEENIFVKSTVAAIPSEISQEASTETNFDNIVTTTPTSQIDKLSTPLNIIDQSSTISQKTDGRVSSEFTTSFVPFDSSSSMQDNYKTSKLMTQENFGKSSSILPQERSISSSESPSVDFSAVSSIRDESTSVNDKLMTSVKGIDKFSTDKSGDFSESTASLINLKSSVMQQTETQKAYSQSLELTQTNANSQITTLANVGVDDDGDNHLTELNLEILRKINDILNQINNGSGFDNLWDNTTCDQNMPQNVKDFVEFYFKTSDQNKILNGIQTAINQNNGLNFNQICYYLNLAMNCMNDEKAKVFEDLTAQIKNMTINSPATLINLLNTTSNLIKNSMSFTFDASALNSQKIIYARMNSENNQMILSNGFIRIENNIIHLNGDFRMSKFMKSSKLDSFKLKQKFSKLSSNISLATNKKLSAKINNGAVRQFSLGLSQSGVSFLGKTKVSYGNFETRNQFITAWNFSFDASGNSFDVKQNIKNATFTSFMQMDNESFISFPTLTNDLINSFKNGEPLIIGYSKLFFNIILADGKTNKLVNMEIQKGKLLFKKANNNALTLWMIDFDSINFDVLKAETNLDWNKIIPEILKLENVNNNFMNALKPGENTQIYIDGLNNQQVALITGFEDSSEMKISDNAKIIIQSSLNVSGNYENIVAFKMDFLIGNIIEISSGYLNFDDGTQIIFSNGYIQYERKLLYCETKNGQEKLINYFEYSANLNIGGKITLNIKTGLISDNFINHFNSIINLNNNGEISINNGLIYRNGTNSYVIVNSEIKANGMDFSGTGLKPQSLLNVNSQISLSNIMGNISDYLNEYGTKMNNEQMNTTATSILSIADNFSAMLQVAFTNPLQSSITAAIKYETDNYNDIFNVLPINPKDIRYIDYYSQNEWESEATFLLQQRLGSIILKSMNSMISSFEDANVKIFLNNGIISGTFSYKAGETSLYVNFGRLSEILLNDHMCNEWTVELPQNASDLNVPELNDYSLTRLSLICQEKNVFMNTENAPFLISSGYVNSTLKTIDGEKIKIENTLAPIIVTGPTGINPNEGIKIVDGDFKEGEILTMHSFLTTQWNATMLIEVNVKDEFADITNASFFMAFQRLPGPLPNDQDFNVTLQNFKTFAFIDQDAMINRTGRYFIGMGYRPTSFVKIAKPEKSIYATNHIRYLTLSDLETDNTVSYVNVKNQNVAKNSIYEIALPFEYTLKASTKGGYILSIEENKFMSNGIINIQHNENGKGKFSTKSLGTFSNGQFNLNIDKDFEYKNMIEIEDFDNSLCIVIIGILLSIIFYYILAQHDKTIPFNSGSIFNIPSNDNKQAYMYLILIDTGYVKLAETESNAIISLVGTQGVDERRNLIGVNSIENETKKGLTWGSRERFLLCTERPLGDIKQIRIWTDIAGRENYLSWYCDTVEIRDMQSDKSYLFKVKAWFRNDLDEPTVDYNAPFERMVDVEANVNTFVEAFRLHNWMDNLTFGLPINGGKGRWRGLIRKELLIFQMFCGLIICLWLSTIYVSNFDGKADAIFIQFENQTFLSAKFSYFDLICAFFIGTFFSFLLHIQLMMHRATILKFRDYYLQKNSYRRGYPYLHIFIGMVCGGSQLYLVKEIFFPAVAEFATSQNSDQIKRVTQMFFYIIIGWVVCDFIKAYILAIINLKYFKDWYLFSNSEKSALIPHSSETFDDVRQPDGDYKLIITEKIQIPLEFYWKLSDEELFLPTLREGLITFFLAVIIYGFIIFPQIGNEGYWTQGHLLKLFNADWHDTTVNYGTQKFLDINKIDDFWNYAQNDLINIIFLNNSEDGEPAYGMRGYWNDYVSRSMGLGIIRQVRSSPLNLNIDSSESEFDEAYNSECTIPAWSKGWKYPVNVSEAEAPYIYRSAEDLDSLSFAGDYMTYSGGGYTVLLNGTMNDLKNQLIKLQSEGWIDRSTKAVFIQLSLYNANVNYFGFIRLVVEQYNGWLYPQTWIEVFRLYKYLENANIVMFFEASYVVLSIYLLIRESGRVLYHCLHETLKEEYITNKWYVLRVLIITCMLPSVALYYYRMHRLTELMDIFDKTNGNVFINMEKTVMAELYFNYLTYLTGIFVSFAWMEIWLFNKRCAAIVEVLVRGYENNKRVVPTFFAIYILYTGFFYLIYYKEIQQYSNFWDLCLIMFCDFLNCTNNVLLILETRWWLFPMYTFYIVWLSRVIIERFVNEVVDEVDAIRDEPQWLIDSRYNIVSHILFKLKHIFGLRRYLPYDNNPYNVPLDMQNEETYRRSGKLVHKTELDLILANSVWEKRRHNIPPLQINGVVQ